MVTRSISAVDVYCFAVARFPRQPAFRFKKARAHSIPLRLQ